MKTPFGTTAHTLDRFAPEPSGFCSDFWNGDRDFFLREEQLHVHRYNDSLHLTDLRAAMVAGGSCDEIHINWGRDQAHPWAQDLMRRHGYAMRPMFEELMALPWLPCTPHCLSHPAILPMPGDSSLEIYRSTRRGIRTYSPFAEVVPLKAEPSKWTVALAVRALLAGQFRGLTCDGVYTDDYAWDNAVRFQQGEFSARAVHFARRILESPSGWRCWTREAEPGVVHICCHSFDSNHFTFNPQPDPNMARFNPLKQTKPEVRSQTAEVSVAPAAAPQSKIPHPQSSIQNSPAPHDVAIKEAVHTKKGHAIWIARLADRVERAEFLRVLAVAKSHGGYWSSFGAADMHGFIFISAGEAEAFRTEVRGQRAEGSVAEPAAQSPIQNQQSPILNAPSPENIVPINFVVAASLAKPLSPWARRVLGGGQ